MTDHAREENPGLPTFLFGQSMGSFLAGRTQGGSVPTSTG